MEKPAQRLSAETFLARNSLGAYSLMIAVSLLVVGGCLFGMIYWLCPNPADRRVYALRMAAGFICGVYLPLVFKHWLKKYMTHMQTKSYIFWSRVLTAFYTVYLISLSFLLPAYLRSVGPCLNDRS